MGNDNIQTIAKAYRAEGARAGAELAKKAAEMAILRKSEDYMAYHVFGSDVKGAAKLAEGRIAPIAEKRAEVARAQKEEAELVKNLSPTTVKAKKSYSVAMRALVGFVAHGELTTIAGVEIRSVEDAMRATILWDSFEADRAEYAEEKKKKQAEAEQAEEAEQ